LDWIKNTLQCLHRNTLNIQTGLKNTTYNRVLKRYFIIILRNGVALTISTKETDYMQQEAAMEIVMTKGPVSRENVKNVCT
jgi:FMN-dependent NADH-azoreductase